MADPPATVAEPLEEDRHPRSPSISALRNAEPGERRGDSAWLEQGAAPARQRRVAHRGLESADHAAGPREARRPARARIGAAGIARAGLALRERTGGCARDAAVPEQLIVDDPRAALRPGAPGLRQRVARFGDTCGVDQRRGIDPGRRRVGAPVRATDGEHQRQEPHATSVPRERASRRRTRPDPWRMLRSQPSMLKTSAIGLLVVALLGSCAPT